MNLRTREKSWLQSTQTDLHGVGDLLFLRHGAEIPGGGRAGSSPRLPSVHTHGQRSLQHRLLAGLVLPPGHHGGPAALLTSARLRLLASSLLLHGDPESEGKLRVVVRVDAELEAATASSRRSQPVLALQDRAGDEGVAEVGAGRDGHQVGTRPLLPVDCRDELVENVSIGVVLPEVDDVDVDLDYNTPVLAVSTQTGHWTHLLLLQFLGQFDHLLLIRLDGRPWSGQDRDSNQSSLHWTHPTKATILVL